MLRYILSCYFGEDVTIHFMEEAEVRDRVGYSFKGYILWHHDFNIKNIEINLVVKKNKFAFCSCQSR